MHSQPTNLPNFSPGTRITANKLKTLSEASSATFSSHYGHGIHASSFSDSTHASLSADLKRQSLWAMIVGLRRKYPFGEYPTSEDPPCPQIAAQFDYCQPPSNLSKCPNYINAYSWIELKEDFDIRRWGKELFNVEEDPMLPKYEQVPNQNTGIIYSRSCRSIGSERTPTDGRLSGNIHNMPLFEANNGLRPIGYVTRIYFGHGNYMIMCSKRSVLKSLGPDSNPEFNAYATKHANFYLPEGFIK